MQKLKPLKTQGPNWIRAYSPVNSKFLNLNTPIMNSVYFSIPNVFHKIHVIQSWNYGIRSL